jgi:hypothetical protein
MEPTMEPKENMSKKNLCAISGASMVYFLYVLLRIVIRFNSLRQKARRSARQVREIKQSDPEVSGQGAESEELNDAALDTSPRRVATRSALS